MNKDFKFLTGFTKKYTVEELRQHAHNYSHQFRFHPSGSLIDKSPYRVFVIGPIEYGLITTLEEVENEIRSICITPEQAIERRRLEEIDREYEYTIDEFPEEDPEYEWYSGQE